MKQIQAIRTGLTVGSGLTETAGDWPPVSATLLASVDLVYFPHLCHGVTLGHTGFVNFEPQQTLI